MKTRLLRLRAWYLAHLATVEDGAAMALVRMFVGGSLLVLLVPFVATEAGREVVRFAFCDVDFGGYRGIVGSPAVRLLGGPTEAVLQGLLLTATIASMFMVVGLFGRVPILVAAVCTNIAFAQNADVTGGGDALLGNALFLLLLADATATLSLDCRWRTGRFVDATPVAAWPRKLALVQLAIVYTVTGVQKLVSSAWTPLDGFSALYQILQSPQWARSPGFIEATDGWLVLPAALMSLATIVWEVGFFMVLIKPRWRGLFAVVGVGIHIGILLLMEVGIFSWLSMSLYPTMFPRQCGALVARFSRRAPPTLATSANPLT
jgi:hypothetical protein